MHNLYYLFSCYYLGQRGKAFASARFFPRTGLTKKLSSDFHEILLDCGLLIWVEFIKFQGQMLLKIAEWQPFRTSIVICLCEYLQ